MTPMVVEVYIDEYEKDGQKKQANKINSYKELTDKEAADDDVPFL